DETEDQLAQVVVARGEAAAQGLHRAGVVVGLLTPEGEAEHLGRHAGANLTAPGEAAREARLPVVRTVEIARGGDGRRGGDGSSPLVLRPFATQGIEPL